MVTHNDDLLAFTGVADDDAFDLLVEALDTVAKAGGGGLGDGDRDQDGLRHLSLKERQRKRGRERERERKRNHVFCSNLSANTQTCMMKDNSHAHTHQLPVYHTLLPAPVFWEPKPLNTKWDSNQADNNSTFSVRK